MATNNMVSIFLTPKQPPAPATEAEVKVSPDEVTLIITMDDDGNQVVMAEIDDVVWQYSQTSSDPAFPSFPTAPPPNEVVVEVRLAPQNTPFGPSTSSSAIAFNLPIDAEDATYSNTGINPLVPNKPRIDAAPPPAEQLAQGAVADGPRREYKYAVVLTTTNQVYTLDPKLIVIRRHRRSNA